MDAEHVGMSARWFSLTLVKGDEGVEAGEERADRALLGEGGHREVDFGEGVRADPHDLDSVCRRRLLDVKTVGLKEAREEERILAVREREAVVVVCYLVFSHPRDRLADVLHVLARGRDDDVAGLSEPQLALHLLADMRERLCRDRAVGSVDLAVVDAGDAAVLDVVLSGEALAAGDFGHLPQLTLFPSGCIICACVCTAYLNTERCKMTYAELLDKHAGENEIRSFLVDGDTVPVTVRIPANLRDCAKEAAALRGMSFSAFMRACMIDELAKGGRK